MTTEGNSTVPPPPAATSGTSGSHRRRHRRGQGRQQRAQGAQSTASVSTPNFSLLPGSSMLCREANEAHLALLSTLPAHSPARANLACIITGSAENDPQQVQNEKMIREFKTIPCTMESVASHDHRCCPFFHSERDRRRIVQPEGCEASRYSAEPCDQQFDDQRQCSHGDACGRCHSTAELLYHPDFFRKRLCHQAKRCPRGRFCAFAHSRQELLVPHFTELEELEPTEDFIAWRFKTQWCPIGGPHDWENCVYAHTYRDWRRLPSLGYSSRPCPHWVQSVTNGPAELLYAARCPRGMSCPLAHGAKEQLYHPQFYKTSPCSEGNCKRGALCAFTHGAIDIRKPQGDEPLPSAMRDPILQAVELLGRSQPTFWSPPRYHALDEPPRQKSSSSKSRHRNGSSASSTAKDWSRQVQNTDMSEIFGQSAALLPPILPSISADGSPTSSQSPTGFSPFMMQSQYGMCQLVPMSPEAMAASQMMSPGGAYGQAMDPSWAMSMACAPWVCGGYMQPPQAPQGMQPGMPTSPYLLTVPMSPQSPDQAAHIDDILGGDQDERPVDGSPQSHTSNNASEDIGIPALPDFNTLVQGGLLHGIQPFAPIEMDREEEILPSHHYLTKGLRTPSSLGSPPLSAAPTEAPSPRLQAQEADSNSSNHDRDSSSNDGHASSSHYVEADQLTNKLKEIKDSQMRGLFATEWRGPQVPAMVSAALLQDTLAIQNFVEAPTPASPTRSNSATVMRH